LHKCEFIVWSFYWYCDELIVHTKTKLCPVLRISYFVQFRYGLPFV